MIEICHLVAQEFVRHGAFEGGGDDGGPDGTLPVPVVGFALSEVWLFVRSAQRMRRFALDGTLLAVRVKYLSETTAVSHASCLNVLKLEPCKGL